MLEITVLWDTPPLNLVDINIFGKEHPASIFREKRNLYPKMVARLSSETLVHSNQTTRRDNLKDSKLHRHRGENLRSRKENTDHGKPSLQLAKVNDQGQEVA
jgi:hypothetical protein